MAENIVIYAGLEKVGKFRKHAVEEEARRQRKSVSDLIWDAIEKNASPKLKAQLEKARGLK